MLKKIICNKFTQKEIVFSEGLNTIIGDNAGSNSIGKTLMLMIIDFVFGGNDYISKNKDVVDNIGDHTFYFIFSFNNTDYYFKRTTENPTYVSICDKNFNIEKPININEYSKFLQEKYNCNLESISFRDIIGRYFRIYGRDNLNEKLPLKYSNIKNKINILNLIRLFGKYSIIKKHEDNVKNLENTSKLLKDIKKTNIFPNIPNKKQCEKNQKEINKLQSEISKLRKQLNFNYIDIDSIISKDIIELKTERNYLSTELTLYENKLLKIKNTITNIPPKFKTELSKLKTYFPEFCEQNFIEVDNFHNIINNDLKNNLLNEQNTLKSKIQTLTEKINSIDNMIEEKFTQKEIKTSGQLLLDKILTLESKIKILYDENSYYYKTKEITETLKNEKNTLKILKQNVTNNITEKINDKLLELNTKLHIDRQPPKLTIKNDSYSFYVNNDTGTGTAFVALILFDLSLLDLTCLPCICHDLPLLKNIENTSLDKIITLYNQNQKQIFISIDKLDSYTNKTREIIYKNKVIELSENKLLFTQNWKTKNN